MSNNTLGIDVNYNTISLVLSDENNNIVDYCLKELNDPTKQVSKKVTVRSKRKQYRRKKYRKFYLFKILNEKFLNDYTILLYEKYLEKNTNCKINHLEKKYDLYILVNDILTYLDYEDVSEFEKLIYNDHFINTTLENKLNKKDVLKIISDNNLNISCKDKNEHYIKLLLDDKHIDKYHLSFMLFSILEHRKIDYKLKKDNNTVIKDYDLNDFKNKIENSISIRNINFERKILLENVKNRLEDLNYIDNDFLNKILSSLAFKKPLESKEYTRNKSIIGRYNLPKDGKPVKGGLKTVMKNDPFYQYYMVLKYLKELKFVITLYEKDGDNYIKTNKNNINLNLDVNNKYFKKNFTLKEKDFEFNLNDDEIYKNIISFIKKHSNKNKTIQKYSFLSMKKDKKIPIENSNFYYDITSKNEKSIEYISSLSFLFKYFEFDVKNISKIEEIPNLLNISNILYKEISRLKYDEELLKKSLLYNIKKNDNYYIINNIKLKAKKELINLSEEDSLLNFTKSSYTKYNQNSLIKIIEYIHKYNVNCFTAENLAGIYHSLRSKNDKLQRKFENDIKDYIDIFNKENDIVVELKNKLLKEFSFIYQKNRLQNIPILYNLRKYVNVDDLLNNINFKKEFNNKHEQKLLLTILEYIKENEYRINNVVIENTRNNNTFFDVNNVENCMKINTYNQNINDLINNKLISWGLPLNYYHRFRILLNQVKPIYIDNKKTYFNKDLIIIKGHEVSNDDKLIKLTKKLTKFFNLLDKNTDVILPLSYAKTEDYVDKFYNVLTSSSNFEKCHFLDRNTYLSEKTNQFNLCLDKSSLNRDMNNKQPYFYFNNSEFGRFETIIEEYYAGNSKKTYTYNGLRLTKDCALYKEYYDNWDKSETTIFNVISKYANSLYKTISKLENINTIFIEGYLTSKIRKFFNENIKDRNNISHHLIDSYMLSIVNNKLYNNLNNVKEKKKDEKENIFKRILESNFKDVDKGKISLNVKNINDLTILEKKIEKDIEILKYHELHDETVYGLSTKNESEKILTINKKIDELNYAEFFEKILSNDTKNSIKLCSKLFCKYLTIDYINNSLKNEIKEKYSNILNVFQNLDDLNIIKNNYDLNYYKSLLNNNEVSLFEEIVKKQNIPNEIKFIHNNKEKYICFDNKKFKDEEAIKIFFKKLNIIVPVYFINNDISKIKNIDNLTKVKKVKLKQNINFVEGIIQKTERGYVNTSGGYSSALAIINKNKKNIKYKKYNYFQISKINDINNLSFDEIVYKNQYAFYNENYKLIFDDNNNIALEDKRNETYDMSRDDMIEIKKSLFYISSLKEDCVKINPLNYNIGSKLNDNDVFKQKKITPNKIQILSTEKFDLLSNCIKNYIKNI